MIKDSIGIDFGTSNTAATIADGTSLKAANFGGKSSFPSHVYIRFDQLGRYHSVGDLAVADYVRARSGGPKPYSADHIIPSIKEGLPSPEYEGNKLEFLGPGQERKTTFFEAEEIAALVFAEIANKLGTSARTTMVGRPVQFSEIPGENSLAQERLARAANMAGFSNVQFCMEPIAAAASYLEKNSSDAKVATVFDLGGGTLDVCVVDIQSQRVIATAGTPVGGTDVDKYIFRRLVLPALGSRTTFAGGRNLPSVLFENLTEWHLLGQFSTPDYFRFLSSVRNDNCSDPESIARLIAALKYQQIPMILKAIEKAKISLASKSATKIEHVGPELSLSIPMDRKSLDEAVGSIRSDITACVTECLNRAGLASNKIGLVIKTGGASKEKTTSLILKSMFPGSNIADHTGDSAVANGLAIIGKRTTF